MAKEKTGKDFLRVAYRWEGQTTPAGGQIKRVWNGGKHTKVEAWMPDTKQRSVEMIPNGTIAKGTSCSICKWFLRLGIVISLAGLVISLL